MTLDVALSHRFADFALDVAFQLRPGITALFGKSGCGKTTVIQAIAGLLTPDHGRITQDSRVLLDTAQGIALPPHLRHCAVVFQEARLFPHLTVRQNLTYGRWFATDRHGTALDDIIALLDIAPLLSRRPGLLSGGEKQRVAIGRALLSNPRILLMDEPLAALDDPRKAEILPYIEQLRDQTTLPILYVSHALTEVTRLANSLVLIDAGRVLRQGPVAAVLSDPTLARSLGPRDLGSVLRATLSAQEPDGLTRLHTAAGPIFLPRINAPTGTILRVRIAAQDVILSRTRPKGLSALNILPAQVIALHLDDGPGALVQLALGDDRLLARITRRSATALDLQVGTQVFAVLKSMAVASDGAS